jgi:outer membrane protein TolC
MQDMMQAERVALTFALCLVTWFSPAAGQTPLSLPALIDEVMANNLDLAAMQHHVKAAQTLVSQAGALADPTLKIDFRNVPTSDFDFDSTPMSGREISITQQFPYWGKRGARERRARHAAAAAAISHADHQSAVVNVVKQAYFALVFMDRSIEITQKNEALLGDFIRISQTKYSVGTGLQQDILKAQVSLSSLKNRLIVLRHRRLRIEAEVNGLRNRNPRAPVGATPAVTQTPYTYDTESLQRAALETRPMLAALEEQIGSWRAAEDLARKASRPDFDVSLAYRQRDFTGDPVEGSDFLSVGVKLNLPIYRGRIEDQLAETRAHLRAVEVEFESMRQQVATQVQQLCVDVSMHAEQVDLFKTAIIPQANQSLSSAISGYQVDKVDFLTLLNNQVTLFNFEIDYHRHLTDYERKLAQLEAVIGKRLF